MNDMTLSGLRQFWSELVKRYGAPENIVVLVSPGFSITLNSLLAAEKMFLLMTPKGNFLFHGIEFRLDTSLRKCYYRVNLRVEIPLVKIEDEFQFNLIGE